MDDRETMVPWLGLDGNRITGEDVLRIRRLVRASSHLTDVQVEALILDELRALRRAYAGRVGA